MNEIYLVHHGIDGQKWGQRNGPPYPLLRNAAGQLKAKAQAKRKAKAEKAAEEKAKQHEAFKKYLRENPEKLYKHRNDLTKEEVDEIMKQIEWDRRVKDISAEEHARNLKKMTSKLNTVANVSSDVWRAYNSYSQLRAALEKRKEEKKKEKSNN